MEASQARKITERNTNQNVDKLLQKTLHRVKTSAQRGYSSIEFSDWESFLDCKIYYHIQSALEKKLVALGYKIENFDDQKERVSSKTLSWR